MPDAHVHAGSVKAVAAILTTTAALQLVGLNKSWYDTLPIAVGSLIGLVIDCDLDIDAGTLPMHQLERAALPGWILGHFFAFYWKPYALLIKHRSLVSHAPVFSTLLRVAYLIPLVVAFTFLVRSLMPTLFYGELWPFVITHKDTLVWIGTRMLIGLIMADTTHFFMDFAHGQYGKENRDGS